MALKDEIKSMIVKKGWTINALNQALNDKKGTDTTPQNLSTKISKETISYKEILEIADILGYEIVWKEKD